MFLSRFHYKANRKKIGCRLERRWCDWIRNRLFLLLPKKNFVSFRKGRTYSAAYGNTGLINRIEKTTGIDLNHDGRIGGLPNFTPHHPPYGSHPPHMQPPVNNNGLINELERTTNIDLNRDGRIGGQPNYPPQYPTYGSGPPPAGPFPNMYPPGNNSGLINELERATNIDLNHDGRIGGQPNYPPQYPPFGTAPPPASFPNMYPPGNNSGLINELERVTNIDLNRDGRIGGQSSYPPMGDASCASAYGTYSNPPLPSSGFNQPGDGLISELEKATNIDLNRDGRIGGPPNYPPYYPPHGYWSWNWLYI